MKYCYYILFLLGLAIGSCSDPIVNPIENQPPQTYLSLFPDSTIAPGSTLKKISWWADDPDGFVQGFRISLDSVNWFFTTRNDSTFVFTIQGSDSTFEVFVAAVDDKGAVDPSPASNLYPVVNTPPTVTFDAGTEIPDTTFPVASFKWTGTDPDGSSTIRYYYWALNDTSSFRQISAATNLLTLRLDSGMILNSNNKLYLKAQDNAGAFSPVVTMPSGSDTWYVKQQTAEVLLIKDMPPANIPTADSYFANAFDTIDYNILDIKSNNGALIPKIVNPMFIETLKLFDVVIWSGNRSSLAADNTNFGLAQNSLPFYLTSGGKVFFTTGIPDAESQGQGNIFNFAPIDSITQCTVPFLAASTPLVTVDNSYPNLAVSSDAGLNIQRVRGIYPSSSSQIIYRISNTSCPSNIVCIKNASVNPNIIVMTLPVYYLNNDPNSSKALFNKIIVNEFQYP